VQRDNSTPPKARKFDAWQSAKKIMASVATRYDASEAGRNTQQRTYISCYIFKDNPNTSFIILMLECKTEPAAEFLRSKIGWNLY
jgi:hypothetical protein